MAPATPTPPTADKTNSLCAPSSEELAPWTRTSLGNVIATAERPTSSGLELCVAGANAGRFLHQTALGDFELGARLDSLDGAGSAGLLVRRAGASAQTLELAVLVRRSADGRWEALARRQGDAASAAEESPPTTVALPASLLIRREGSTLLAGFTKADGVFQELKRVDIAGQPSPPLEVGPVEFAVSGPKAAVAHLSAVQLQAQEPSASELLVGLPSSVVGGEEVPLTIVRSFRAEADNDAASVTLASDTPALKVPATITFSKDASSAAVNATSNAVKTQTTATVTAQHQDKRFTGTVTLLPSAIESLTVARPKPKATETEVTRLPVTVQLSAPAPQGGLEVELSGSNAGVRVPRKLKVPAGSKSANFEISGSPKDLSRSEVVAKLGNVTRTVNIVDVALDPDSTKCGGTLVTPDVATDGQKIYFDSANVVRDSRAILTGYRYNDSPRTKGHLKGEGREAIYCGCQRVRIEAAPGVDGETTNRPYVVVPSDAPSGEYSIELLPPGGECSRGGIRATCPANACRAPSLSVVRSYVVPTMERLHVLNNSEVDDDHPGELAFVIAGSSGTAFGEGSKPSMLVNWSGSFPGGDEGSAHVTNADGSTLRARIPLFVGREMEVSFAECQEECVALPAAFEAQCLQQCTSNNTLGRYNNQVTFAVSGVEYDSSPSKVWGYLAGVGSGALACLATWQLGVPGPDCATKPGAGEAIGIGTAVSKAVNAALEDDDDRLGTAEVMHTTAADPDWITGSELGPVKFQGEKKKGELSLYYTNRRAGAPRILSYRVTLRSLTLDNGYELLDCKPPNEIFVNARAALYQGTSLPQTKRFPQGKGLLSFTEGQTHGFGDAFVVGEERWESTPDRAPESPFIYVEFGVWENDDSKDLVGIHADTIFLTDILSKAWNPTDEFTPEGFLVRRTKVERSAVVQGFDGSDNNCRAGLSALKAFAWDPKAPRGRARLTYRIDVKWLRVGPWR
jgi:hypothetical protein